MTVTPPETIESGPAGDATAAVIWLHGLGADGHDFEPIVPQLALPSGSRVRFIFPHAPFRPVTLNGGCAMRAWYDLYSLEFDGPTDDAGLEEARVMVEALIAREAQRGLAPERIVLAGFSQGGAVALYSALRFPKPLAGVIALSTYLPAGSADDPGAAAANRNARVFMAHGTQDAIVKPQYGHAARDALLRQGCRLEWREYVMPHSVCPEEVQDIGKWLGETLALVG